MGSWRRRKECEQDSGRKLRSHLELKAEKRQENGLSPEAARHAAQRRFGNTTLVQEDIRAVWGWGSLERLVPDLRNAVRLLPKSSAFTITALTSLAIGIGMNTTIFTFVDAVLLRTLPVRSPEELVLLTERFGSRASFSFSMPAFAAFQENDTLAGLAAFRHWRIQTSLHGGPSTLCAVTVTLLGVAALAGYLPAAVLPVSIRWWP